MKLGGIFRFEVAYQLRRPQTWAFVAAPAVVAYLFSRDSGVSDALRDDFWINSPSAVAMATLVGCLLWLLIAPSIAGEAAARDAETGMDPLTYTTPVSRAEYLGGRFFAAFALNALILFGAVLGSLIAVYVPGNNGAAIGPFRPAAYLTAFGFILLPNAFIASAIQFTLAALSRRTKSAYLASFLLFFVAYIVSSIVYWFVGRPDIARMIDPIGVITMTEVMPDWTPLEKRTRLLTLEGPLLWNRVIWIGIAISGLLFTHQKFQFAHHAARDWWARIRNVRSAQSPTPGGSAVRRVEVSIPRARRSYGVTTRMRQALAIARASFASIVRSWGGFALLAIPVFAFITLPFQMEQLGVPIMPRTAKIISLLTAPVTGILTPWVIVPLLILYYTGELIWREREAGMSETVDAAPVPESMLVLGKFLGLALVIVLFIAMMTASGVLIQVNQGWDDFQIGLYLKVMFGLQLTEYILFAVLAFAVHVTVNNKHVGYLVTLVLYASLVFAPQLGVNHNLLIYGASPAWSYTEMRGFGGTIAPWLWFKLYWCAWALLLVIAARLLWVRGREESISARVKLARRRFTGSTVGIGAVAVGLILVLGGFVFYNTNVLNEYRTASDITQRAVEYERRFRRYENVAQPRRSSTELRVEIYPEGRSATFRGIYHLVNESKAPIDSIHLTTAPGVAIKQLTFDRPARVALADDDLGYRIYSLEKALEPGDSIRLSFDAIFAPRGFTNSGINEAVAANRTYLPLASGLPSIGYDRQREITSAQDRRALKLAPRPLILPSLYDSAARYDKSESGGSLLDMVVGTNRDQIAVAPGTLRNTWIEKGRRYFRYVTSAPIGSEYGVYSAKYAVREAKWKEVAIRIFHDPSHTATLDDMVRSVQASLDYYTENFSPYAYTHIQLVEGGGNGIGLHAEPSQLTYSEGFTSWKVENDPRALNLPFATVAHEMGHQWWPTQLSPALVEGAPFFSESLAWYSAMQVIRKHYGKDHLRRLMLSMREPNPFPRVRRGLPLMRADDPWAMYRRGPFAMIALSEYIGESNVNTALRRMIKSSRARRPSDPLQTTLDLYRELQRVTPDSLRPLLRDLFEINTVWEFDLKKGNAVDIGGGKWRVTLDVEARKEMVDTAGVDVTLPLNDPVEIGIFAPAKEGEVLGKVLYLQKHVIRSNKQTITVIVSEKPDRAGIDPYNLLDYEEGDNIEGLRIGM
jgi:ABC-type transport system involved in multi-copper enzyme maturation permease subunit